MNGHIRFKPGSLINRPANSSLALWLLSESVIQNNVIISRSEKVSTSSLFLVISNIHIKSSQGTIIVVIDQECTLCYFFISDLWAPGTRLLEIVT